MDHRPLIPWQIAAILTETNDRTDEKQNVASGNLSDTNFGSGNEFKNENEDENHSDEKIKVEIKSIFKCLLLESILGLMEGRKEEEEDATGILREIERYGEKEGEVEGRRSETVRKMKEDVVGAVCPSLLCILSVPPPASSSTLTSAASQGSTSFSPFSTPPPVTRDRSEALSVKLLFIALTVISPAKKAPFLALVLPLVCDFLLQSAPGLRLRIVSSENIEY